MTVSLDGRQIVWYGRGKQPAGVVIFHFQSAWITLNKSSGLHVGMGSYKCDSCGVVHTGEHNERACSEKMEERQRRQKNAESEHDTDNPEPSY